MTQPKLNWDNVRKIQRYAEKRMLEPSESWCRLLGVEPTYQDRYYEIISEELAEVEAEA